MGNFMRKPLIIDLIRFLLFIYYCYYYSGVGPIHKLLKLDISFAVNSLIRFLGPINFSIGSSKIKLAQQNLAFAC